MSLASVSRLAALLEDLLDANLEDARAAYATRRQQIEALRNLESTLLEKLDVLEDKITANKPVPHISGWSAIMAGNVPAKWVWAVAKYLLPLTIGGGLIELIHRLHVG